jgi:HEAT repeat protein
VDVQREAVKVLGQAGNARAVEALTQALKDVDYHIRVPAKRALARIEAKKR